MAQEYFTPLLLPLITAFGVSLAVNYVLSRGLIAPLKIIAQVNGRSSHAVPVPVGGGAGIVLSVALALPLLHKPETLLLSSWFGAGLAALACLSWWNDKVDLNARLRFGAQALVAAAAISLLPEPWNGGLYAMALLLCLLWFTNLYNFMDGSDGMLAVQTLALCIGLYLYNDSQIALLIGAATLAFFYFNFPPARIFAGDVASIPLGLLLGVLLFQFALAKGLVPALILPLYFVMDASLTLARRVLKREKFWQAHNTHFFQQAIKKGFSHRRVMLTVLVLNLWLLALAGIAIIHPIPAGLLAVLAVSGVLWHFRQTA